MKKLALGLMALSAAVFGFGTIASAQYGANVVVSPASVSASGRTTVTFRNCTVGQSVAFSLPAFTPARQTIVCAGVQGPASLMGFVSQVALGNASATFTAPSPAVDTTYPGTATPTDGASLPFSVTVLAQPATTTVPGAASTTPTGGLPSTGSAGISTTTGIAAGLLAVGLGLFIVATVRRRRPVTA